MATLRRQFDKDEDRELRRGRTPPHTVTSSTFIWNAIQIEEQQYVPLHTILNENHLFFFRQDIRSKEQEAIKAKTIAEGLAECRKHLVESIQEFRNVQRIYMPGVSHLLDDMDDSRLGTRPELFKLMLPSQLSSDNRQSWCLPNIPTLKARFRYAQADDALAEIRQLQRLYQGLSDQNRKHINNSQGTGTCSKGTFKRYKARISRFAALYCHAHRALIALDPTGEVTQWTSRFLELKEGDIRGPGRDDDDSSEGRIVSSWIWLVPKSSQPTPDDNANPDADTSKFDESNLSKRTASGEEVAVSICAHWARCQARAERYEEEVELTLEEMRRTLEFFKWKSQWWLTLQDARVQPGMSLDPQVLHGLRAYSHRQSSTYSSLVTTYINHWRKFLVEHSLRCPWLSLYPTTPPPTESVLVKDVDELLEDDEDEDEPNCEDPADPEFEERFVDLPGS